MDANKYRISFDGKSKQVNIPIEISWDMAGQEQSIELYEDTVVKEVIGEGYDFEVQRFPHDIETENNLNKTEINYEFYFHNGNVLTDPKNWTIDYRNLGFTNRNLYYFENNFSKSFFKLDFYDTVDNKRQTNYMTVIIPTQQGKTIPGNFNGNPFNLKIPNFSLDYVGDKEGFFLYWLKNLEFLDINTFYMTAKFYDASKGQFIKMMNEPQGNFPPSQTYSFDSIKYFYYRVVLDYINKCYRVFKFDPVTDVEVRVGTTTPIKWYEYVNPV